MKKVLHIESGPKQSKKLHEMFRSSEWEVLRMDRRAGHNPDIVGSLHSLSTMQKHSLDAIWSSHDLAQVHHHEIIPILQNARQLLKPDGFFLCMVFDTHKIAEYIVKGNWSDPIRSRQEQIPAPIDMLYGPRKVIRQNGDFAFKTGFTARSLAKVLELSGFSYIRINRNGPRIYAWAQNGQRQSSKARIELQEENIYGMMKRRDEIDRPPTLPVNYQKHE